jgi:hypothetical protein
MDAERGAGEAAEEGVRVGVAEPVREPEKLAVPDTVGETVWEGVTPGLQEGVGEPEEDTVLEGVGEHVVTSATLPAGQDAGHPHATQAAAELAPRVALKVPAAHGVGAAALFGQKDPAGHAAVVMV